VILLRAGSWMICQISRLLLKQVLGSIIKRASGQPL